VKQRFRTESWRQALVTYAAVLPVSLLLNFALNIVTGDWPKLLVVVVNAAILVAVLNWGLLPLFSWFTRRWAARPPIIAVDRRSEAVVKEKSCARRDE
jgi:antibiotic biosynthesis monooxygenase (ABM) superfamily enzyme